MYLRYHDDDLKNYVPTKSKLIDKEAELLILGKTDLKNKQSKLNSLLGIR
jgi:hypothetical protein